MKDSDVARRLLRVTRDLVRELAPLRFEPPVTHVYNPLEYARAPHEAYIRRYARPGVEAVLLGMNPGPFGMAQTGVPFGEISSVRDWLGLKGRVTSPPREHPKRPILGFDCHRREVSGARLWGWAEESFGKPENFFARFFIVNYCPLVFLEESGRNRTPDKLAREERELLFAACDRALRKTVEVLAPRWVIGIGVFAEKRAQQVLGDLVSEADEDAQGEEGLRIGRILHPSPQSPAANRGWAAAVERDFDALGISLG